ncbi:TDP-N-acetylfucosamine:lipid II N-acetylfucosaminyltransferase family protein [Shewanella gaetbuli]
MALRIFEKACPAENQCVIVTDNDKLFFVKNKSVKVVNEDYLKSKDFSELLGKYDGIILHSLFSLELNFPKHISVAWIGWGYDYYDLVYTTKLDMLDVGTRKLAKELDRKAVNPINRIIKSIPFLELFYRKQKQKRKIKVINENVDYFLPVLDTEYEIVKSSCKNFKPKFLDWNYGTLENDFLKGYCSTEVTSSNILIGNSASVYNNHVESFELLTGFNLNDVKIIVPLSYGDCFYRDEVISLGNNAFNNSFMPLVDFMPIEQYIDIISSCGFVIMNHIRQQAVGNIVIMMYLGAKVFLRDANPVYGYFKSKGAIIYSIEELKVNPNLLSSTLCRGDVLKNRDILQACWGEDNIITKTKRLVENLGKVRR